MDNSLFYINFEPSEEKQDVIQAIRRYSSENLNPVYVINKPLGEKKYKYNYEKAIVVLTPKHKLMFINFGSGGNDFDDYMEDFIEDMGYISNKYDYVKIVGRPRNWRDEFIVSIDNATVKEKSFVELLNENKLHGRENIRKGEVLISLLTGSINEVDRIGGDVPVNVLDQIKRKIILFDGEQTRFIFDEPKKKRITIQGLAGTGKTELLLHKIKELYTIPDDLRIVFTCHNKILADNLSNRVPTFFNFMKVEEQIRWNERLWVMSSWGSQSNKNSGVYSYICNYYNIPFQRFSYNSTFDNVCRKALEDINRLESFNYCFDYILIDESQDFSEGFFSLCEKVAKFCVYVAGDIFQNIFENEAISIVNPDFLLNKCYRTDPRTLMGAHAIGMGLFEKKLRWLKDDEWEACGYDIEKRDGYYNLSRKPLRRFEDVDSNTINGIEIIQMKESDYSETIINIINKIVEENSTVEPDDIGIMFLENTNDNYKLATELQVLIKDKFDWEVNIGYETKVKRKGTLFISNRNNVKGLEFPFVISIMQNPLISDFQIRNSVYMMLTRSFLTSYFVIPQIPQYEKEITEGINFVNRHEYLHVSEPSLNEKKQLYNAIINRKNIHKSQYDIVEEIMDVLKINKSDRSKLHKVVQAICKDETDRDKLYDVVATNFALIE